MKFQSASGNDLGPKDHAQSSQEHNVTDLIVSDSCDDAESQGRIIGYYYYYDLIKFIVHIEP